MPPILSTMESEDVEEVGEVKFSMMTSEEIRAMSACEIVSTELFNGVAPVPGGLYDPRMGAYDYGSRCHTCMHTNAQCIGHYGHVELAAPVFNIETREFVKKFLRCVCTRCSALMLKPDDPDVSRLARKKITNAKRFKAIEAACTKSGVKACPTCGARRADNVAWNKSTASSMVLTWKAQGETPAETIQLSADQVDAILRNVSAADAAITGIHRPDAMLITVLPVPPIAVRPPAKNSSGQRRDDDLTIQLVEIVKSNNLLKARMAAGASSELLASLVVNLQINVITYINNSTTGGAGVAKVKATNRALRSVTSRLKGKEGRIRGNLSGKRVDQSARSVITPDPNISVEELGMPLRIAKTLSMPEVVRADNVARLQLAVENGPSEYPGAIYVKVSSSGALIQLKRVEARRRMKLEPGDVVHRHLMNGDVVLFNRQPSLHRMSMMAHRVRVMPFDTFRLSVMVTPPYNADFDGDEMNAHCPQSAMTATELRMLSGVASQIITPRSHEPIIGVVQDVALGVHLITDDSVTVSRKAACNLLAHMSTCSGDPGPETWTGKQLLSALLPQTLHVDAKGEVIEFGELKAGKLNKKSYQRASTGIVHSVYNDNGPARAVRLLDDTQNLTCDWLVTTGFSVGIGDLIGKDGLSSKIEGIATETRQKVTEMLNSLHSGAFVSDPFISDSELVEALSMGHIKTMFFNPVGEAAVADSEARGSRLLSMINAGSKGQVMNVCQMMGGLGQQDIERGRVPLSFEGRVLPHFSRYDDGCDARGFVESSFVKGLKPKEFFMHAMAGREGLIDTAVKSVTRDTAVMFLEDGVPMRAMIGDWIDGHLARRAGDVQRFQERDMELLDLVHDVFIPTTDYSGRVTWGRVTAMTRHDPGTAMYRIKTAGGRSVTVTESKSLLIWQADICEFREVPTPTIVVGDCVPVTLTLPDPPCATHLGWHEGVAYGEALRSATHVDPAALCESKAYIAGAISGFVGARDGSFFEGGRELCEGVAMLCSRIGIYCDLTDTGITVYSDSDTPPERNNDVVLDRIVEIEVIAGFTDKVYDLTVPETLNFGLANGLQVRDTSETGYLQRKLIKALEDCKVTYDRSVRMPNGGIVQFLYGEDGMDACSIETHDAKTFGLDLAAVADRHLWTAGDTDPLGPLLAVTVSEALKTDKGKTYERLEAHFRQVVADKDAMRHMGAQVYHCIAFDRLLRSASKSHSRGAALDLHPATALDVIDELVGKMGVGPGGATPLLAALLRAYLSPKVLIKEYAMSAAGLEAAKAAMERAFMSALCSPSEMVGILAAQSLAEPLTQMVLNTFHTTGVGSATKALGGVPRIKELLAFTRNPKTPLMQVYLTNPDRANAVLVRDRIRFTTVGDLMLATSILYETDDYTSEPRLAALYKAFGVDSGDAEMSPWILRIEFDRAKMIDAAVHMHDVHRAITENFIGGAMHTDDASHGLIMRFRPPATSPDMMSELIACEDSILATKVSGVASVKLAHEFADDSAKFDAAQRTSVPRQDEWKLTTQGANFMEILSIDGVDKVRTTTNVIHEILDVLGIEAARGALLAEITTSYGDSYVNHRHIALLVDFMVQSGGITPIDRHGINHGDIGPLAKCSFEQPVDKLIEAAVFRESDKVEGVSASIMLGQVARCGTGDGDLILDSKAYAGIDGDRAEPADLRNAAVDVANEPALDAILAFSFAAPGMLVGLDISPERSIAAIE